MDTGSQSPHTDQKVNSWKMHMSLRAHPLALPSLLFVYGFQCHLRADNVVLNLVLLIFALLRSDGANEAKRAMTYVIRVMRPGGCGVRVGTYPGSW